MTRIVKPFEPVSRCGIDFSESVSLAQNQFEPDSNINRIIERVTAGLPVQVPDKVPVFADVSNVQSLQDVFDLADSARAAFDQLPKEIKAAVNQNPAAFPSFALDPRNHDLLVKHGLAPAPAVVAGSPEVSPAATAPVADQDASPQSAT